MSSLFFDAFSHVTFYWLKNYKKFLDDVFVIFFCNQGFADNP